MDFIFSNDSCKLVARFCFPYLSKVHLCVITIIAKYTLAHIGAFRIYNVRKILVHVHVIYSCIVSYMHIWLQIDSQQAYPSIYFDI